MDRRIAGQVRETFHSSLRLTEMTLIELGKSAAEAERAVNLFRVHDEKNVVETHAYYDDERRLMQNAQEQAAELTGLFEADQQSPRQPVAGESTKWRAGGKQTRV
jgi:hypothetical protein